MKNLNKILLIPALVFMTWACNDDYQSTFPFEDFVHFGSSSVSVDESVGTVTFTVQLVGEQRANPVNVTFDVDATNLVQGEDFTIPGGTTLTIPANSSEASFDVEITDDAVFEEGPFVITLSLVDAEGISLQSESSPSRTLKITVLDDDCPFTIEDWVGAYAVDEAFTGPPNAPLGFSDFFGESYQVELSIDPNDPNKLSAIWNNSAGYDQFLPDGTKMSFKVCDQVVEFPDGDPEVAAFTTLTISSSSFDEGAKSIRVDGDSNGYGDYGFTLTKL